MKDIFDVAVWVHERFNDLGLVHGFIGGLALQAWGEARVTRDVDVAVMTGFGNEREVVERILGAIPSRHPDPVEFALANRVILAQSPEGIGIDIGLSAFPYEEQMLARCVDVELVPGVVLPLAGPDDLIIQKVFAGRPRDWEDVRGIIARRGSLIDWELIDRELVPLLELIGAPERYTALLQMRDAG